MSKLHSKTAAAALALLAALVFLIAGPAGALAQESDFFDEYPSCITAFDVDITVQENNVCRVVNEIDMKFAPDSYSHGLYMTVDLAPHVFFEQDGEFYTRDYRAHVSNVSVSGGPYETEQEGGELTVRVGDPDVLVDGRTLHYTVAYDYDAGADGFPDFDMFYYGIIGNGWSDTIDNISFAVHMPKEFDPAAVGFSVGGYGAEGYDPSRLHFTVDGTDITGSYTGKLDAYEGIWIRMELPAGYFVDARRPSDSGPLVIWVSGFLTAAAFVLWLCCRPRREPVVTVEFGPPAGLNSADVGCIADGRANVRDIMSLIMWWASKGYIKIVEIAPDEGKKKKKKKGLLFVRLQDLPDDADSYQTVLFDKIFEDEDRVAARDLRYKMSGTVQEAVKRLNRKFSRGADQLFTTRSRVLTLICGAMACVPPALLLGMWAYEDSFYEPIAGVVAAVFSVLATAFATVVLCSVVYGWPASKKRTHVGGVVACSVLIGVGVLICGIIGCVQYGPAGLIVLGYVLIMLLTPLFRTRTDRAREWYGKILGLKRFIERAEKSRLEVLVEENPEYFYDILPFAYVLGVTDVWAKQFEELALAPPSWYAGSDMTTFSAVYLTNSLARNMERAQSDLTAVRGSGGSGGGGGFSGGGFSGGGFGGSGGGSW